MLFAKAYMEPYIGFSKIEVLNESKLANLSSSTALGIRLGYRPMNGRFLIFGEYFTAGPYKFETASSEVNEYNSNNLHNATWTHKMTGIGIGFDYDVVGCNLTYGVDSKISHSQTTTYFNQEVTLSENLSGASYKASIFFHLSKETLLNIEYLSTNINYDVPYTYDSLTVVSKHEANQLIFAVSLPVDMNF